MTNNGNDLTVSEVISRNLREICESRKILYKEVIRKAGISSSAFYEILGGKGNPRVRTLLDICEALNISLTDLISDENPL